MIGEIYMLGVRKRLRDLGIDKEAGAKHLALGVGGAMLGAGLGSMVAPALTDQPKGVLGLPPTRGQLEFSLKQRSRLGTLLGGVAGAGLGAASPKILALLKKIRGEKIKDILSSKGSFWS
jgi:hypothetical protein